MGSGEREIGSKSSSLPQDPGDLAGLNYSIQDIDNTNKILVAYGSPFEHYHLPIIL